MADIARTLAEVLSIFSTGRVAQVEKIFDDDGDLEMLTLIIRKGHEDIPSEADGETQDDTEGSLG